MTRYRGEVGSGYACRLWIRLVFGSRVGRILNHNFLQLLRRVSYKCESLSISRAFVGLIKVVCRGVGGRGAVNKEPAMATYSLSIQDKVITHIFDNSLVLGLNIPQVEGPTSELFILRLKDWGYCY